MSWPAPRGSRRRLPGGIVVLAGFLVLTTGSHAFLGTCECDPARRATLELRECSLCREAERQPAGIEFFFLHDISPLKPNRMLLLPRAHGINGDPLSGLTAEFRAKLWKAAIAKGRELWGGEWGAACNGYAARSQCHLHIHIGKLIGNVAQGRYVDVNTPEEIPVPDLDKGIWIHQQGAKIRVHLGEIITETVLMR